jgi:hypothetical protein
LKKRIDVEFRLPGDDILIEATPAVNSAIQEQDDSGVTTVNGTHPWRDMCQSACANQDVFYASCRATLVDAENKAEDIGSVFANLVSVFTDRPEDQWIALRDEVMGLQVFDIMDTLFNRMRYRHNYIKTRKTRWVDIITRNEYYISISIKIADRDIEKCKYNMEQSVHTLKKVYQSMVAAEEHSMQHSTVMEIACTAMRDHLAESLSDLHHQEINNNRIRLEKRYADFTLLLQAMKGTQTSYDDQKMHIIFMIDEIRRILDVFIPFCEESIKISQGLSGRKAKKFYNEFVRILDEESGKAKKENTMISNL